MKIIRSQRFAIIGVPGSGKSTFAIKLADKLKIPVHHLDRHMFEPGGKKKDKREFMAIQQAMVNENSWVIEGCSISTLDTRFAKADTVIYFRFSRLLCLWRIFKRMISTNEDHLTATGSLKGINWTLIKYIWAFDKEKSPDIEKLIAKYPSIQYLVFTSPKQVAKYLNNLS